MALQLQNFADSLSKIPKHLGKAGFRVSRSWSCDLFQHHMMKHSLFSYQQIRHFFFLMYTFVGSVFVDFFRILSWVWCKKERNDKKLHLSPQKVAQAFKRVRKWRYSKFPWRCRFWYITAYQRRSFGERGGGTWIYSFSYKNCCHNPFSTSSVLRGENETGTDQTGNSYLDVCWQLI